MVDEALARSLQEALFSDPDAGVYAILDGASIGRPLLENLYGQQPEFHCLLPGDLEPDMAEVAPYLVRLESGSKFARWVLEDGWGNHWGLFATASADGRAMRGHFRSLLDVYDADSKPLIFRFYDPRVLRVYLPTCNADELVEVFGPVASYRMEGEEPGVLLTFRNENGTLRRQETPLGGPRKAPGTSRP